MASAKRASGSPRTRNRSPRRRPKRPTKESRGFVGRDPSPVLDRYPPKSPAAIPGSARPLSAPPRSAVGDASATGAPSIPGPTTAPPEGLIRLERPFDPDDFSQLLGETAVRLTVPSDALPEVLRRVTDFMGFGIYVYAISIRPAPSELLKGFVVELQRVEYDPAAGAWKPFVEKGAAASPGGGPP
jgi:hypothetical protein